MSFRVKLEIMISTFKDSAKRYALETWDNRKMTWQLALQRIVREYKGTALGVVWAVLQPLAFVGIYWFAIEIGLRGGRDTGDGFPFVLWIIPAIFAWRVITAAINGGGNSVRNNSGLVTKVVFPVFTIPQMVILSLFVVHIALMLLAIIIFLLAGFPPTIYWLGIPYAILVNFAFCLVVALVLSAFSVFSRDLTQFVKTIMSGLFWFSPVLWPLSNLDGVVAFIVKLNPIAYVITSYRWAMIYGEWFWAYPVWTAYFWGFIAVMMILAIVIWSRSSKYFADVL
jgi:ABC-type polysaccharide/polyol phosphate export permease